jgi:hypothetical protein
MKILEGNASEILLDWAKDRYQVFYKYDGYDVSQIEIYETETKTSFLPNEETEYFLGIILTY